jgi:hypothetical protein
MARRRCRCPRPRRTCPGATTSERGGWCLYLAAGGRLPPNAAQRAAGAGGGVGITATCAAPRRLGAGPLRAGAAGTGMPAPAPGLSVFPVGCGPAGGRSQQPRGPRPRLPLSGSRRPQAASGGRGPWSNPRLTHRPVQRRPRVDASAQHAPAWRAEGPAPDCRYQVRSAGAVAMAERPHGDSPRIAGHMAGPRHPRDDRPAGQRDRLDRGIRCNSPGRVPCGPSSPTRSFSSSHMASTCYADSGVGTGSGSDNRRSFPTRPGNSTWHS